MKIMFMLNMLNTLPITLVNILLFFFGACLGSFANVCIYRIPRGLSIISPSSQCPHCGHAIRWRENIPILSYIFLRGRCSGCKEAISIKYPMAEAISALITMRLYAEFGISIIFCYYLVFFLILLIISFIDMELQIIPDKLSISGIFTGIAGSYILDVPSHNVISSILGALLGGGILFIVLVGYYVATKKIGLGLGDVKLLSMIGAFLGWDAIPFVLFIGAFTGSIWGIGIIAIKKGGRATKIPFGPFLSLGAMASLLLPSLEISCINLLL